MADWPRPRRSRQPHRELNNFQQGVNEPRRLDVDQHTPFVEELDHDDVEYCFSPGYGETWLGGYHPSPLRSVSTASVPPSTSSKRCALLSYAASVVLDTKPSTQRLRADRTPWEPLQSVDQLDLTVLRPRLETLPRPPMSQPTQWFPRSVARHPIPKWPKRLQIP
ncbi:hypothetical protein FJTKL_03179 [Diaporthe vaccinii]|uniref:Uncharacterized protein n=1 Tax=Diaporthe vaccinii TaxID=105482 RepID=A0ABR4DXC2_9PEZI